MNQGELQNILFVGLGNPGSEYEMTRHNMGFLLVEAFAKGLNWSFKEDRRFNAKVVKGMVNHLTVHLLLPLTFMNLSGIAVRRYIDYYKISVNAVLIIADDIALPFRQMRLRAMGSAGGHNGLKSIESYLGTSHYKRLRMGIGHPGERVLTNYVLEPFSSAERLELPIYIAEGVMILQRLLKESFVNVMNQVNTVSRQAVPEKRAQTELKDLTKPPSEG